MGRGGKCLVPCLGFIVNTEMKEILLSFRRIWSKTVFWFAYFFRIKYETANTTLMVAIIPAMIAVSRGVTYLGQCLYYGLIFNVPMSLIQNSDSVFVSFINLIIFVLIAACGSLWVIFWISFISKRTESWKCLSFCVSFVVLFPQFLFISIVFPNPDLFWRIGSYEVFIMIGMIIGLDLASTSFSVTLRVLRRVFFGLFMAAYILLCTSVVTKPYPITTNDEDKTCAIVYLTNDTAVLDEVEFTKDEDGKDVLIIHKNKQEIPSSLTALTYEYQTFDRVEIKP